jgi:hypothetical protein
VDLLSAMFAPAILISACGTLIFSTSTRLARIVDRVRELLEILDRLSRGDIRGAVEERRHEIERQLASHTARGRLIQESLTCLYYALGTLVGATAVLGIGVVVPALPRWVPGALVLLGTLVMFYGCVLLIRETRMALKSIGSEMEFALDLSQRLRREPKE